MTKSSGLVVPYATSQEIFAASILLPLLGIVFVLLRFYARVLQKQSTGIDDWLMLLALALVMGMGVTLIIGVHGKAIAYPTPYDGDLTLEEKMTIVNPITRLSAKIQYAFATLMILSFGIIKLSITLYYRRIFVGVKGTLFDWITRTAIVIVVLWTIACLLGTLLSCGTHFYANWGSYCGAMTDITNAFVVSDLITDIMILCLPLPVIWNLQMAMRRKLIVIGILATGAVSIVASIIKVIISFEIENEDLSSNVDADLTISTILYWSLIEGGLAIIAACLPTLRCLISKLSLSSIVHSVRNALSIGSKHTQEDFQRLPVSSNKSHPNIQAGSSSSSTSRVQIVVKENSGPVDTLAMGGVDGLETTVHSIQVTKQFSQSINVA